jgi:hypothetical protein
MCSEKDISVETLGPRSPNPALFAISIDSKGVQIGPCARGGAHEWVDAGLICRIPAVGRIGLVHPSSGCNGSKNNLE